MLKINKVSIGSAFRVGIVITGIFWIIFALLSLCLVSIFPSSLDSTLRNDYPYGSVEIDAGRALLNLVCGVPVAAIIGGIFWALAALIYNVVARWVGGLEVEYETFQKPTPYSDPRFSFPGQKPDDDTTPPTYGDRNL